MTNHCPRCGIDSLRTTPAGRACTDPSCAYPEVTHA